MKLRLDLKLESYSLIAKSISTSVSEPSSTKLICSFDTAKVSNTS